MVKKQHRRKLRIACLPKDYKFPSIEDGQDIMEMATKAGWNYVRLYNRFDGSCSVVGTPPHRNFDKIITEEQLKKEWT